MLALLPKAYLFDSPVEEGDYVRIHFRPNPDYQAHDMEERVLHGMTGSVLIDRQKMRLRELDGRMDNDVSLGFGPLAVIKAGSNFFHSAGAGGTASTGRRRRCTRTLSDVR